MKRIGLILLAALTSFAVLWGGVCIAAGSAAGQLAWSTTQVTDNTLDDLDPQVSDGRVVWQGYDGTDYEIFTWKVGDSAPTQLTENTNYDAEPQVSGNRVTWYCWDGTDSEIFTWKAGDSAPTQLTENITEDNQPRVSGDRVVWEGADGTDMEIFTWKAGDSAPTQLTDDAYDDGDANVSGDRVIWEGVDGTDCEIFTWKAGDLAPTQLTDNETNDDSGGIPPQVSGDRVVWAGDDGSGHYEIFTWKAGDLALTQLTDNESESDSWSIQPRVSGDRVVWWGWDGADTEIFTWKAGDSAPTQLTDNSYSDADPQVSGDRVVWAGENGSEDVEIFTWEAGDSSPAQLTDNSYADVNPMVCGDMVVWNGFDGATYEVYRAELQPSDGSIKPRAVGVEGSWSVYELGGETTWEDVYTLGQNLVAWTAVDWQVWPAAGYIFDARSRASIPFEGGQVIAIDDRFLACLVDEPAGDGTWSSGLWWYDLSTMEALRLGSNPTGLCSANTMIDGGRLVWEYSDPEGGIVSIRVYDGDTGQTISVPSPYARNWNPRVSGKLVVFEGMDDRDPWVAEDQEIMLYDLESQEIRQLTENSWHDGDPQTDGTLIAWNAPGGEGLYVYTVASGELRQIPTSEGSDLSQRVDNGRVYWSKSGSVYSYDPLSTESDLVVSDVIDWGVSNGRVVFTKPEAETNRPRAHVLDLATAQETCLSETGAYCSQPRISGDLVTWHQTNPEGGVNLYVAVCGDPLEGPVGVGSASSCSVGDVSVTFSDVADAGVLTSSWIASISEPSGYRLAGQDSAYDISTSAGYTGPITVAIAYNDTGMTLEEEANLRLFHWEGESWFDITTSVDTTGNIVAGVCDSLSPFAICVPVPLVTASPADVNFGDVEIGCYTTSIVTVTNTGASSTPLSVTLDEAFGVSIVNPPTSWPQLAPGDSLDITLRFAPSAVGITNTVLRVTTQDPSRPQIRIAVSGNGVRTELPPGQEIDAILTYFDTSVAADTLYGIGQGKSAGGREEALRNMIEAAGDLIGRGRYDEAARQLRDAQAKCDGLAEPPDFVGGTASSGLLVRIGALILRLDGMSD